MKGWRKLKKSEVAHARQIASMAGIKYIDDIDLAELGIKSPLEYINETSGIAMTFGDILKLRDTFKVLLSKKGNKQYFFEFHGIMIAKLDIKDKNSTDLVVMDMCRE